MKVLIATACSAERNPTRSDRKVTQSNNNHCEGKYSLQKPAQQHGVHTPSLKGGGIRDIVRKEKPLASISRLWQFEIYYFTSTIA